MNQDIAIKMMLHHTLEKYKFEIEFSIKENDEIAKLAFKYLNEALEEIRPSILLNRFLDGQGQQRLDGIFFDTGLNHIYRDYKNGVYRDGKDPAIQLAHKYLNQIYNQCAVELQGAEDFMDAFEYEDEQTGGKKND